MKKIPTIFERDFPSNPSRVTDTPNPECGWVFLGEGVATRKYDGTCCMFDGKRWFKRREVKAGRPYPGDFVHLSTDATTGESVGWVFVDEGDKWHLSGIVHTGRVEAGTYELVGPKVQGNPEGYQKHMMVSHAAALRVDCPRDFEGLGEWLRNQDMEGVVFQHPDGRMAKIKRRDFGHK